MKILTFIAVALLFVIALVLVGIYFRIDDAVHSLLDIADNTASTNRKAEDMQRSLQAISCNTLDSNYGVTILKDIRHRLDRKFWCKWRVVHDVTHDKH